MHSLRPLIAGLIFAPLFALAALAQDADAPGSSDFPLIPRYEGAVIKFWETSAYDAYTLLLGPVGLATDGEPEPEKTLELEGRFTEILYRGPEKRSSLEVFRNYEAALTKAGFETLFTCSKKDCGPRFRQLINPGARFDGLLYDNERHYIAAKISRPEGDAYLALYVTSFEPENRPFVYMAITELAPMEDKMVVVEASEIQETMARDGKIAIYGILFDFDQASILPESKAQIDQLAAMLAAEPALSVLIVGHTDGQGAFDYNLSLSQRRAQSVVDALAALGIASERMTPAGAGMVAPVATNRTDEGRARNRRVEIVELVRN
ncbi:OmpA family protein [Gemmobacter sp. 24YEA27]|uniref:OmpA family protein n=1 Tax=Gemmobacter sp. 24YEA27 TaxID=3040672 RepID=UPI0024B35FD2|nr:OmpA family protein [Gemmobacter sp. 24YEA27]